MLRATVLSAIIALCAADCYMHMPRGSNNRLNEASANRNNGNRCFDSQNNNRGGYNVCDLGTNNGFDNTQVEYFALYGEAYTQGFFTGDQDGQAYYQTSDTRTNAAQTPQPLTTQTTADYNKQTERFYWEESYMGVTWTIQHGSGDNPKLYSQFIAQYMVENMQNSPTLSRFDGNNANNPQQPKQTARANPDITQNNANLRGNANDAPGAQLAGAADTRYDLMRRLGLRVMLSNGRNTNTPSATSSTSMTTLNNEFQANSVTNGRCQHECNEWYSLCRNRDRNKGLFTADQNVNEDRATHTRQNPNGNRRGLECPEERDYYPYWYPTPFVDVAILTTNVADCNARLKPESQNTKMKYACTTATGSAIPTSAAILDAFNQTQCAAATGGTWSGFSWNMPAPQCLKLPHSQVNHLGNMVTGSISGQSAGGSQSYFMWQLPKYADLISQTKVMGQPHVYKALKMRTILGQDASAGANNMMSAECVRMLFRVRYNMSTLDYDPYTTNATQNNKPNQGIISPIQQNPTVEMGVLNQGLRLAINTAQTGRTFQDRSHTFLVCKRPAGVIANKEILNVQVQGKRGNIVQTFPATEYQFSPRQWTFCPGRMFHFQWSGSNTHNNGNPAGDGQAGDAGEGRGGSDRHQLSQMLDMQYSYPAAYDTIPAAKNFWNYVSCYAGTSLDPYTNAEDAAIAAGTSGYYHSRAYAMKMYDTVKSVQGNNNNIVDERLQETFNNMSASYRSGIICQAKGTLPAGTYFAFMCTRNNNFTNRAQKMKVLTAATCGFAQNQTPIDAVGSVNQLMAMG